MWRRFWQLFVSLYNARLLISLYMVELAILQARRGVLAEYPSMMDLKVTNG